MKKRKRLLSILLAICLVATLVPGTAFAAGTGEAVQTFSAGSVHPTGSGASKKFSSIYYGVNGSTPIKWYVLDGKHAVDGKTDGMLLLSEKGVGSSKWSGGKLGTGAQPNPGQANATDYQGSKVREFLHSFAKNTSKFSALEQSSMLGVSKAAEGDIKIGETTYGNAANSGLSKEDKIFALSINEINNYIGTASILKIKKDMYWSRSRVIEDKDYSAKYAAKDGLMGTIKSGDGYSLLVSFIENTIRPGMNLSKNNILFLSDPNNTGHQEFGMTEDYNGTEWKLTLKDGNSFSTGSTYVEDRNYSHAQKEPLTIHHPALSSISQDYTNVTAALFNSSGKMIYYGSINSDVNATTSTLRLPKNCPVGNYTLRVYGEDWNGAKRTDYATGTPYSTQITVESAVVPRFKQGYSGTHYGYLGESFKMEINLREDTTLPVTWSIAEGSLPDGLTLNQDGTITGTPKKLGTFQFRVRAENAGGYFQPAITITISKTFVDAMAPGGEKISGYNKATGEYDYIYFGKNGENSIKWRVLAPGTENSGLFLLSDGVLEEIVFSKDNTTWKESAARSWSLGKYGHTTESLFSGDEQEAIVETTTETDEEAVAAGESPYKFEYNGSKYSEGDLENDSLFFLSMEEAVNSDYGLGSDELRIAKDANEVAQSWWLRSTDSNDLVGYVEETGNASSDNVSEVKDDGSSVAIKHYARPALFLDPDEILFASDANNSMHQEFSAIKEHDGNEWKLTLADDSDIFDNVELNKDSFIAGETMEIRHPALQDISEDYTNVTMALTDNKGNICYYGSINKDVSAEVSTVTIPGDLAAGNYELCVYGEVWNGEYETDYATGVPFVTDIVIRDSAPVSVLRLENGYVGKTYDETLDATGSGDLTWSLAGGSLPDGLTLNKDGGITGKPTREGVYAFTVKAENDLGSSKQSVRIRIYKTIPNNDGSGMTNASGESIGALLSVEIDPNFEDDDIMHDLLWLRPLNTVDEIHENMKAQIMAREKSVEDTEIYNVVLMYSDDGDTWLRADKEHFPEDGKIFVQLPVPEGTDPEKHDYVVSHMFSMDAFGHNAGEVEFPEDVEEKQIDGKWYLEFHVTGLSPITVGWTEKDLTKNDQIASEDPKEPENPTDPTKPTDPSEPTDQENRQTDTTDKVPEGDGTATGDDSSMGVWFGLAGISAAAMAVFAVTAWRRRRTD